MAWPNDPRCQVKPAQVAVCFDFWPVPFLLYNFGRTVPSLSVIPSHLGKPDIDSLYAPISNRRWWFKQKESAFSFFNHLELHISQKTYGYVDCLYDYFIVILLFKNFSSCLFLTWVVNRVFLAKHPSCQMSNKQWLRKVRSESKKPLLHR